MAEVQPPAGAFDRGETDHEQLMRALKRIEMDTTKIRTYSGLAAVATIVMAIALVLWLLGAITIKFEPITSGF